MKKDTKIGIFFTVIFWFLILIVFFGLVDSMAMSFARDVNGSCYDNACRMWVTLDHVNIVSFYIPLSIYFISLIASAYLFFKKKFIASLCVIGISVVLYIPMVFLGIGVTEAYGYVSWMYEMPVINS